MMRNPPLPSGARRVSAAITCFNRRETTLASLRALANTARAARVDLHAILVDDASSDGTADAVRAEFDWVDVVDGTGDLFWNRGMHVAYGLAMAEQPDYFLWLNDDTLLCEDALGRLISQAELLALQTGSPVVVVGSTFDDRDGQLTYGGLVARSRFHRFRYEHVWNDSIPLPCDTMNGNCVLVQSAVAQTVGNLDPLYEHAMGDTDYALRARESGFPIFVAGGVMGHCARNPRAGSFADASLPWRRRWALMLGRKGLPVRSWLHFTRRHGGLLWPLYFVWPYAKLVMSGVRHPRRVAAEV